MAEDDFFFIDSQILKNNDNEVKKQDSKIAYYLWCLGNLECIDSTHSWDSSSQNSRQSHQTVYKQLMCTTQLREEESMDLESAQFHEEEPMDLDPTSPQDPEISHQYQKRDYQHLNKEARDIFTNITLGILGYNSSNVHHFVQTHVRILNNFQSLKNKLSNTQDSVSEVTKHFKITDPHELSDDIECFINLLQSIDLNEHFREIPKNNMGKTEFVQRLFRPPEIQNLFQCTIRLAKINLLRTQSRLLSKIFQNEEALGLYERFLEVFYLP